MLVLVPFLILMGIVLYIISPSFSNILWSIIGLIIGIGTIIFMLYWIYIILGDGYYYY